MTLSLENMREPSENIALAELQNNGNGGNQTRIDEYDQAALMTSMNSSFTCPICLDLLQNTMVTECLHRFCKKCITDAIQKSNRECPTCRKKLVSRRNLRPDRNIDQLIGTIWPDRTIYEQFQTEKAIKYQTNIQALQKNIKEGMKEQARVCRINGELPLFRTEIEGVHGSSATQVRRKRGRPPKSSTIHTSPDSGVEADLSLEATNVAPKNADDDFSSDISDSSSSGDDSSEENTYSEAGEDGEDSGGDGEDEAPARKRTAISGPTLADLSKIGREIGRLLPQQGFEESMKGYVQKYSKPMGTVSVHLRPLPVSMGGKRTRKAQNYRTSLPHITKIGDLHSKFTRPEFHPLKGTTSKGNLPPLHLSIQDQSKQMIELHYRDTICMVLGLAYRQNFLDFPTIYFH